MTANATARQIAFAIRQKRAKQAVVFIDDIEAIHVR
jgi:hypothetical protein